MTVRQLIEILIQAEDLESDVYVDSLDEQNPVELERVDNNEYAWGFIIGKADTNL